MGLIERDLYHVLRLFGTCLASVLVGRGHSLMIQIPLAMKQLSLYHLKLNPFSLAFWTDVSTKTISLQSRELRFKIHC